MLKNLVAVMCLMVSAVCLFVETMSARSHPIVDATYTAIIQADGSRTMRLQSTIETNAQFVYMSAEFVPESNMRVIDPYESFPSFVGSGVVIWDLNIEHEDYFKDGLHRVGYFVVHWRDGDNLEKVRETRNSVSNGPSILACYVSVKGGKVVESGGSPMLEYTNIEVVAQVAPESGGLAEKERKVEIASSFPRQVTIAGRVEVLIPGGGGLTYGVPNIVVRHDWNIDNNASTYYHPDYIIPQTTAVTDENGNFTFVNYIENGDPSVDPIIDGVNVRVYAKSSNGAGWDDDQGENAYFANNTTQGFVDFDYSTYDVIEVDLPPMRVDPRQGMALRHLWRGRQFSIVDFGYEPPRIKFNDGDIFGNSSHHYRSFACNPPFDLETCIVFFEMPWAITGYHEYAHHIHREYTQAHGGPYPSSECDGPHSWNVISNRYCAFSEGFAEFVACAMYAYYIQVENGTTREAERGNNWGSSVLHFPDRQDGLVTSDYDLEGMVATFLFGLWDDVRVRAATGSTPDYQGDNEDLGWPFGYPHSWMLTTLPEMSRLIWETFNTGESYEDLRLIRMYRDAFIEKVRAHYPLSSSYHERSIVEYELGLLGDDALRQNPATPTELVITKEAPVGPFSTQKYRRLTWNDNVEPSTVEMPVDFQGLEDVNLNENEEDGFIVWRKELNDPNEPRLRDPNWESREIIDGWVDPSFEMIAVIDPMVGAELPSYLDTEVLPRGWYLYVVSAFTDKGVPTEYSLTAVPPQASRSIPKAEAIVEVEESGSFIKVPIWGCWDLFDAVGVGGNIIVSRDHDSSGTTSSSWVLKNKPSFIDTISLSQDSLMIVNLYPPSSSFYPNGMFSVQSVRSDSVFSDTSAPYYPLYVPLPSVMNLVYVSVADSVTSDVPDATASMVARPDRFVQTFTVVDSSMTDFSDSGEVHVRLAGHNLGLYDFRTINAYRVDHPKSVYLDGNAECGFAFRDTGTDEITQIQGLDVSMRRMVLDSTMHTRYGNIDSIDLTGVHNYSVDVVDGDTVDVWYEGVGYSFMDTLTLPDTMWVDSVTYYDTVIVRIDTLRATWASTIVLMLDGRYHTSILPNEIAAVQGEQNKISDKRGHMSVTSIGHQSVLIEFMAAEGGSFTVCAHNVRGGLQYQVSEDVARLETARVQIDASSWPSGGYVISVRSDNFAESRVWYVTR